jgi:hypothetical protein
MKTLLVLLGLLVGGGLLGCSDPPLVLQGTVQRFDAATHRLVVRDELPPNAEKELATDQAEIGAEPAVGDLVRVAYRERDGRAVAGRIMNLTRQAEVKGGGGH